MDQYKDRIVRHYSDKFPITDKTELRLVDSPISESSIAIPISPPVQMAKNQLAVRTPDTVTMERVTSAISVRDQKNWDLSMSVYPMVGYHPESNTLYMSKSEHRVIVIMFKLQDAIDAMWKDLP